MFFAYRFIWVALSQNVVTGRLQLTLLAEVAGFFAYCWRKQGETLGMRAWKLRILDDNHGELPSFKQIGLRLLIAHCLWPALAWAMRGSIWVTTNKHGKTKSVAPLVVHIPDRD